MGTEGQRVMEAPVSPGEGCGLSLQLWGAQAEGVASRSGSGLMVLSQKQQIPAFLVELCVSDSASACQAPEQPVLESDTAVFLLLEQPAWLSPGVILPQDFLTASTCAVQLLNTH